MSKRKMSERQTTSIDNPRRAGVALALSLLVVSGAGAAEQTGQGVERALAGNDLYAYPAPPGPYQSMHMAVTAGTDDEAVDERYEYDASPSYPLMPHYRRPYHGPGRYWAPSDWEHRAPGVARPEQEKAPSDEEGPSAAAADDSVAPHAAADEQAATSAPQQEPQQAPWPPRPQWGAQWRPPYPAPGYGYPYPPRPYGPRW